MFHRPLLLCLAMTAAMAEDGAAAAPSDITAQPLRDQVSHYIGLQMAGAVKQHDLNVDVVVAAIRAAVAGTAAEPDRQAMMEAFQAYQQEQSSKAGEKNSGLLAAKAAEPGATKTDSGLIYTVVKATDQADAKSPGPEDTVKVHYRGTFTDGRQFDASQDEPATFKVGQVVRGWTEALQLMKEGDKFHLVIPPELGYGEGGAGPIPPNSVLEFDVELVEVVKGDTPAAPPLPMP